MSGIIASCVMALVCVVLTNPDLEQVACGGVYKGRGRVWTHSQHTEDQAKQEGQGWKRYSTIRVTMMMMMTTTMMMTMTTMKTEMMTMTIMVENNDSNGDNNDNDYDDNDYCTPVHCCHENDTGYDHHCNYDHDDDHDNHDNFRIHHKYNN